MSNRQTTCLLLLAMSFIVAAALFAIGTYAKGAQRDMFQVETNERLNRADQAVAEAKAQAEHDRVIVVAMCKRFNRDEVISADLTAERASLERSYVASLTEDRATNLILERRYHTALAAILKGGAEKREFVKNLNCPRAMERAMMAAAISTPAPSVLPVPKVHKR